MACQKKFCLNLNIALLKVTVCGEKTKSVHFFIVSVRNEIILE